MLVLQALHGLSLAQTEYLVADRPSWMRSCRLALGDAVPDANTPQDFHEALIVAGTLDALFARLDRAISEAGYLPMAGQIRATPRSERRGDPGDATLVAAPRQRHTEAEKARIKAGQKAAEIRSDQSHRTAAATAPGAGERGHVSGACPCRASLRASEGVMGLVIRTIGLAHAQATIALPTWPAT
ncbi:transposase [Elioraea sp.]|uniref:transposase n=1 Tax=Elioraea sp. TaxID=2185103 RepID=UPI0021DC9117|nr:transposase [Elioraea sp.]GIX10498.1 MAG: hypothetical protein KatS3mg116_2208 [Elioraea sp.]